MDVHRKLLEELAPGRVDVLLDGYKAWKNTEEGKKKKKKNLHLIKASPLKPEVGYPDFKDALRRLEEDYKSWKSADDSIARATYEHEIADARVSIEWRLCHRALAKGRSWLVAFFQFCQLNLRNVKDIAWVPPKATESEEGGMTLDALSQQLFDLGFYEESREVKRAVDMSELIRILEGDLSWFQLFNWDTWRQ